MSLRHDDELPPLTPAQQAEAIRLAARLQAEHEARNSSEALFRAAEEAGIDPRFLRDAVRQVSSGPTRGDRPTDISRPLKAVGLLCVINWLALIQQPAEAVGLFLNGWWMLALVGAALLGSAWVGQERRVRWTMPVAVIAVWIALALPDAAYHISFEGRSLEFLPTLIVIVGGLQFVAALVGAFVHWHRPVRRPHLSHSR